MSNKNQIADNKANAIAEKGAENAGPAAAGAETANPVEVKATTSATAARAEANTTVEAARVETARGVSAPYLGIIEGFYGRRYSKLERQYLFDFAHHHGYRFYIYAPKEDEQLRAKWQQELSYAYKQELSDMASRAHGANLDFGVALSPLHLTKNFATEKELVLKRVSELCQISKCEIFCLLFDDMSKDSEDVGKVQNEIISKVEQALPSFVKNFIICPAYYTDDPILDKLFGTRPETYFSDLTQNLPERVEIFWTGPKVLSPDITAEHLAYVTKLLGRKPFIWDNYPVNDGKKICRYLYLEPFAGRRHLTPYITGHAVNPMVQPLLSTLPSVTLPLLYADATAEEVVAQYRAYAHTIFGKAAPELLNQENLSLLTRVGRDSLSKEELQHLQEIIARDNTPALEEIADFLQGSMRFDQAIVSGTHIID